MLGSASEASYEQVLPLLLADPGVDAVIALFVPAVSATAEAVAAAVARAAAAASDDKPVLAVVMSAEGIPVPLREERGAVAAFAYPESAARALGRAAERADWLRRPLGTVPELDGIDRDAALAGRRARPLARPTTAGSSRPRRGSCCSPTGFRSCRNASRPHADEAVAAAEALGYPVVVKTAEAGAHKTETGGIALDLTGDDAVRAAAERIGGPVVVQPMVVGGAELLAGLVQDPVFGPLVAFGPGGVFAELIGQASFRIAPLTDVDAEELVSEGKAGRLVRGFRGAPAGRRRGARRPRAPARPPRRGRSRGRRARPESRARAARGLRRRRCTRARRATAGPRAHEDLVTPLVP